MAGSWSSRSIRNSSFTSGADDTRDALPKPRVSAFDRAQEKDEVGDAGGEERSPVLVKRLSGVVPGASICCNTHGHGELQFGSAKQPDRTPPEDPMAATDPFPLPRGWTKTTRSSVLHAISLAFMALTRAWASSATSRRRTTRLQVDLDRAATEITLLNEELAMAEVTLRRNALCSLCGDVRGRSSPKSELSLFAFW